MQFHSLKIKDAFLISDKVFSDERGAFTEVFEKHQFEAMGVNFNTENSCFSFNKKKGTLRGLHYQEDPYSQAKLVTCVAGSCFDVIVDLRRKSATYLQWDSFNLEAFSGNALFIPKGCAHGFVTLSENTVISYLIQGDYIPTAAKAARFNDPAFKIKWPLTDITISVKDREAADFEI